MTATPTIAIAAAELGAEASYRLLTGLVVPRPIAWVTTLGPGGRVNLAPFSHFTFVSPKPPMLAISVGQKAGVYKDTARNIMAHEEFVVHIADRPLIREVHESAVEHPPEVSEADLLGLAVTPGRDVAVPRLTIAPVAMECRLRHVMEFGETRSRLMVGEVLSFHLREGLLADGKVETRKLDPICRLAGPNYATLGEIVTMVAIHQTSKS
ncbi:flavin reductase family protein [Phreatobacter sp. AB_2022a]|uniref:flavin reductase family protein n=1 Tax=Phreatobacter sp. AB_2022a TaxID=3003134 RepID=UPI0022871C08|nr:flavin reductase family protein [Phreatobacter sp. AB_2022a]MCZ0735219.1 flavin reductase family protein [Phreatobacter sp. AB_2022a]